MSTPTSPRLASELSVDHRDRLMQCARRVDFPEGTRLFEEDGLAERFWFIRTGTVTLDIRVPGRRPTVIDTVNAGELLGWSWLFAPYHWHFGAEAMTRVRAYEFDAATVRMMMDADPRLGSALGHVVGQVLAQRLVSARVRLLDLYAAHGSGL
ncbi:cyclic nucleotide-binding domain-containing protein [Streptomyces sp. NBC_00654]|uniref:Crp/Fnr family transcriptional regulator n=1 Tax=Streptomyces sp. NBC_00654 TaxID=2975799 RepID=UPI0022567E1B|nr:cyclic nucleotide-binding domain-containing protein [Streptomyces sp. NBC_00654]MCX4966110.1 cyclic nucleotide-binding domain-containing protein [Streptomyces sp. NBC_00654]